MHAHRCLLLVLGLLIAALLLPATAAAKFRAGALEDELGPGVTVEKQSETKRLRFVGTAPGKPIDAPIDGSRREVALAFAQSLDGELGVGGAGDELDVTSVDRLDDGRSSVRLQQEEEGVPVIGGEVVVNLDRNRDVLSLSGEATPRPDLDTDPGIGADEADDAAFASVSLEHGISPDELQASKPELSILDSRIMGGPGLDRPTLVWRVEVTPADPDSLEPIRQFVAVDAQLGNVTLSFNQIAHAKDRVVCDAADATAKVPCTAPFARVEGDGATGDTDVDLAYDYAGDTYDFFANRFGRDSLDDAGLQLISTVNYCQTSCPYLNAFWSGSQMVYGDGFPAADDVVGHELGHGVTDFSSSLFYYYQSGAINESMSDVFGEFVDLTNGAGSDDAGDRWLVGEDVPAEFNVCGADTHIIRNMADPGDCGDPDRTQSPNYFRNADTRFGVGDNGGVHINSGINNKAVFLLTDGDSFNGRTVDGLGLDKVAQIYYEVNNSLLTSASDYQDLGAALRQACTNLIGTSGIDAGDCGEVDEAVLATEMDQQPAAAPTPVAKTCVGDSTVASTTFFDDLETPASGNWATSGSGNWFYPQTSNPFSFDATFATSGDTNFWGYGGPGPSDSSIAMANNVTIPAGGFLHFNHSYGFVTDGGGANGYDGGLLEYSTDNGGSWTDAADLFEANGYNGTVATNFAGDGTANGNVLAGQDAFVADSSGYISSRADLSSLSGQDVRFRFRIGTGTSVNDYGWFIDDIRIYTCTPPPDTTAPETQIDSGPGQGSTITAESVTFGFSSPDDPTASFSCSLDGGPFGPCTAAATHTLNGLANGSHTFAARASDVAGNTDATPATRTFTVQLPDDPPSVPPADPPVVDPPDETDGAACATAKKKLQRAKKQLRKAAKKAKKAKKKAKRASGKKGKKLEKKAKKLKKKAKQKRKKKKRAQKAKKQAC